jgi:hypothetical protein
LRHAETILNLGKSFRTTDESKRQNPGAISGRYSFQWRSTAQTQDDLVLLVGTIRAKHLQRSSVEALIVARAQKHPSDAHELCSQLRQSHLGSTLVL